MVTQINSTTYEVVVDGATFIVIESEPSVFDFYYEDELVMQLRVFRDAVAYAILTAARTLKDALTKNNW